MRNGYIETTTFEQRYEDLMRWVSNDYSDMLSVDHSKFTSENLMLNIANLDIGCVIKSNNDYINFISDLKSRINIKLADEIHTKSFKHKLSFLMNNYHNKMTSWESKFVNDLYSKNLRSLSIKQESTLNNILKKYKGTK